MRSPKAIQSEALRLIKAIVKAMALFPDKLTMTHEDDGNVVTIKIVAHPNDAKIIVGTNARHLGALYDLSKLLFWGTHKFIKFESLVSLDMPFAPRKRFTPRADWPEEKVRALILDTAKQVFPDLGVALFHVEPDSYTTEFGIILDPWVGVGRKYTAKTFSTCMSVLFVAIGMTNGRRLYVELDKLKTHRAWMMDASESVKCKDCGNAVPKTEIECGLCGTLVR